MSENAWGPWDPKIDPAERLARLRAMRAIVLCGFGPLNPMFKALFLAESGARTDLDAALLELDRMPALDRRKVLSVYGRLIDKKGRGK